MKDSLNYVFRVSALSCSGDGSWITRNETRIDNAGGKSPQDHAGAIAARELKPVERGVRVEFLGLQVKDSSKPLTPCNPFTLELRRTI